MRLWWPRRQAALRRLRRPAYHGAVTMADWRAKVLENNRARREICGPRGAHRPVGPAREMAVGGTGRLFRRCADCGTWVPKEE